MYPGALFYGSRIHWQIHKLGNCYSWPQAKTSRVVAAGKPHAAAWFNLNDQRHTLSFSYRET